MFESILNAVKDAFSWLMTQISSLGNYCFEYILSFVPPTANLTPSGTVGFALDAANQWVPIDLAISLLIGYVGFVVAFLAVKVIVKMIP